MLDYQQPPNQAGFRKEFSTTDHLHTVNQIIEKVTEYQMEIHLAFVDYKKAFDSIRYDKLMCAYKTRGYHQS